MKMDTAINIFIHGIFQGIPAIALLFSIYLLLRQERKRSVRWLTISFLSAIPTIVFICIAPFLVGSREKAGHVICMNNLAQIGKYIEMYQIKYSNYPPSLQNLTNISFSLPKHFICRLSGHQEGSLTNLNDWTDYYYISGLKKSDPPECVIAYCCSPKHRGGLALHLDGSVSYYRQNDDLSLLTNNFGITNQTLLAEIKTRAKIIRGTGQIRK